MQAPFSLEIIPVKVPEIMQAEPITHFPPTPMQELQRSFSGQFCKENHLSAFIQKRSSEFREDNRNHGRSRRAFAHKNAVSIRLKR
jgi:hypothetical protein